MTTGEMKETSPLSAEEARRMHAYWGAASYLSVGQIYLLDNPLLLEPLKLEWLGGGAKTPREAKNEERLRALF